MVAIGLQGLKRLLFVDGNALKADPKQSFHILRFRSSYRLALRELAQNCTVVRIIKSYAKMNFITHILEKFIFVEIKQTR